MSDIISPDNISNFSKDFLFQQELYLGLGERQFNVRARLEGVETLAKQALGGNVRIGRLIEVDESGVGMGRLVDRNGNVNGEIVQNVVMLKPARPGDLVLLINQEDDGESVTFGSPLAGERPFSIESVRVEI